MLNTNTLLPCRVPQHCGVFCNAKYRGGVRRTEGLKKKTKKYGYSAFTGKSKALINHIGFMRAFYEEHFE